MINKYEAVGIFASIALMTVALFLLRVEVAPDLTQVVEVNPQTASIAVVDENAANANEALFGAIVDSLDDDGAVRKLIIDDVVIGTGPVAEVGNIVTAHYVGTLQNGQQFDSSYVSGKPFTFTLGEGRVIEGWETGLLGMQAGGERILVIPPEMGYGQRAVGPIPANSILVFSIKLLEIN